MARHQAEAEADARAPSADGPPPPTSRWKRVDEARARRQLGPRAARSHVPPADVGRRRPSLTPFLPPRRRRRSRCAATGPTPPPARWRRVGWAVCSPTARGGRVHRLRVEGLAIRWPRSSTTFIPPRATDGRFRAAERPMPDHARSPWRRCGRVRRRRHRARLRGRLVVHHRRPPRPERRSPLSPRCGPWQRTSRAPAVDSAAPPPQVLPAALCPSPRTPQPPARDERGSSRAHRRPSRI